MAGRVTRLLLLGGALWTSMMAFMAAPSRAAETDPYYGWWVPPRDGSLALDDAINRLLQETIADENARRDRVARRCEDIALHLQGRLAPTAGWFFLGLTRSWNVDVSPHSSREYVDEFGALSVYTPARLFPFGKFVPVDPSVRVGVIVFGTDKIAHFFTNGARYYRRFLEEKAAGKSDDDAIDAAITIGVGEEAGVLGQWASGIFSFADLQANLRGLFWYRSLCEGAAPRLALVDGRWRLEPFSIAEHVDPCFDEAFEPSAFDGDDAKRIRAAVVGHCSRFRTPSVQRRWRAYLARDCPGRERTAAVAERMQAHPPEAHRIFIDRVCAATNSP
jgi:hypothetical protein